MKKRPRRKKTGLLLLVAFFLLLGGVAFWFLKDDPPPDDADLRIPYKEIPDEENAFTYFNKAIGELHNPSTEEKEQFYAILDGESWDEAFVEAFLAKNGRWCEYIEEGLRCAQCRLPEMTSADTFLPHLAPWRQMARLSSVRALYLSKTGKEQEALDECMRTITFARRIENSRGCLIVYLVGRAVEEIGLGQFRSLLAQTTLPAEALAPYIRRLSAYPFNKEPLADTFKTEYTYIAMVLDEIATGSYLWYASRPPSTLERIKTPFVFKPNRTKRIIAKNIRLLLKQVHKPYAKMHHPTYPAYATRSSKLKLWLSGNAEGEKLAYMTLSSFPRVLTLKCCANGSIRAIQILIALKCYKQKTGDLPDSLDELVPEYLTEIPLDDFDGKPMKYSKKNKVVYAVGTDLVDNGGVSNLDRENINPDPGYDFIFKINF